MDIGRILKSKQGNVYIELGQPKDKNGALFGKNATEVFPITLADGTVLNAGDVLFLKDPRTELDELASRGTITEDVANERKSRIPAFVRFKVQLPNKG